MNELSELLMVEIFAELEKLGKYAFRGMGSEKKFAMAQRIAKKVEELGYVKVVRCGECRWWGGNHSEHLGECSVCASRLEKGYGACYGRFGENVEGVLMKAHEFCYEGEAKEGSHDAV